MSCTASNVAFYAETCSWLANFRSSNSAVNEEACSLTGSKEEVNIETPPQDSFRPRLNETSMTLREPQISSSSTSADDGKVSRLKRRIFATSSFEEAEEVILNFFKNESAKSYKEAIAPAKTLEEILMHFLIQKEFHAAKKARQQLVAAEHVRVQLGEDSEEFGINTAGKGIDRDNVSCGVEPDLEDIEDDNDEAIKYIDEPARPGEQQISEDSSCVLINFASQKDLNNCSVIVYKNGLVRRVFLSDIDAKCPVQTCSWWLSKGNIDRHLTSHAEVTPKNKHALLEQFRSDVDRLNLRSLRPPKNQLKKLCFAFRKRKLKKKPRIEQ